jgi:hypothetical protein
MELHCECCNSAYEQGDRFCGGCRAQVDLPKLPEWGALPPVPPPFPEPSRHRGRNSFFVILGVILVGCGIVCAALLLWPRPDPIETIDEIQRAYTNRDVASFDRDVDIESILTGLARDTVNFVAVSDYSPTYRLLTALPRYFLLQKVRKWVIPKLVEVTRETVSGGDPSVDLPANDFGMNPRLYELLSEAISKDLSFQGARLVSNSGTSAIVDVIVNSKLSEQPIVVRLRMKPDGDHWKVVSIENVAEIVGQVANGE